MRECFGVRELFFILNMVMVTGNNVCVKSHEAIHQNNSLFYFMLTLKVFLRGKTKNKKTLSRTPNNREREREKELPPLIKLYVTRMKPSPSYPCFLQLFLHKQLDTWILVEFSLQIQELKPHLIQSDSVYEWEVFLYQKFFAVA